MLISTNTKTVTKDSASRKTKSKQLSFEELEETLLYFASSITHKNSEEEIVWDLVKNCISRLGLVDCVVYFLIERKGILVQKAAYGPKNPNHYEILAPIDIPLGTGITGTVAMTGKAEIIPDTSKDSRYFVDDEARLSEICIPIIHEGKVLGVIDCEHPERNFFTEQHLRILSAIASICAMKISWLRAQAKIQAKQQSLMDARQDMADLKIKAIKAQMNPHFIFNALNAIQHFISENDKKASLSYLSIFSKLIRYSLNIIDQDKHLLQDEIRLLKWYLELQKLRYDHKFNYNINYPPQVNDVAIPTLIVQLMVEDIIENLMMDTQERSSLQLNFTRDKTEVTLTAIVTMAEDKFEKRQLSYRNQQTPWFEQLLILNRIRQYGIGKSFEQSPIVDGIINLKWTLNLPII